MISASGTRPCGRGSEAARVEPYVVTTISCVMSKLGSRTFFSFSRLTDQTRHWEYGEWHGLDHMPENVALDGVALGTRWVRTPACVDASATTSAELGDVQYLTTYWFRDPYEASIKAWDDLASMSRHWGRRPELGWTERRLRGYFVPVKGLANPRTLVSPGVIPYRPTRGIYLTVSRLEGAPVDVVQANLWYHEVHLPDVLTCDGAAGAWTFVSDATFLQDRKSPEMASFRVTIVYLDDDPIAFAEAFESRQPTWEAEGRLLDTSGVETRLLASPLETVVPWSWNWFDPVEPAKPGSR